MMISQQTSNRASHLESSEDTQISRTPSSETVARGATKEREAEISRLTWAVLDGKATNAERMRLAELVSAQHRQH